MPEQKSSMEEQMLSRLEELIIENRELKHIIEDKKDTETASNDSSSYTDPLTGLYSRSYIESLRKGPSDKKDFPMAVIYADINGLKNINDTYGIESGNILLKTAANAFKESLPSEAIISRAGGSSFIIITPRTDVSEAKNIRDKILSQCRNESFRDLVGGLHLSLILAYHIRSTSDEPLEISLRTAETILNRRKLLEPDSVRHSIVVSAVSPLKERYDDSQVNVDRMIKLCRLTGHFLDLPDHVQDELELACVLHDIGKIAIRESIINKNAKLTKQEKKEIQNHPLIGYNITNSIKEFRHVSEYILYHHEKWDGTGYPNKLKGEEIPLVSRIIALVDAYDAMTTSRPYREALSEEYVINEIRSCAGTQFDPKIADVFLEKILQI